jgi:8-oxo-dGTP pyrophosphatase MutT (NUDIX family)
MEYLSEGRRTITDALYYSVEERKVCIERPLFKEVTAAIIMLNNRVLIAQRAPKENLAGKWEFPGGKVEIGETLCE